MTHQTTQYQIAQNQNRKKLIPTAYATLENGDMIEALSIDGAVKLAAQVAQQFDTIVIEFGACGGVYSKSEDAALETFMRNNKDF